MPLQTYSRCRRSFARGVALATAAALLCGTAAAQEATDGAAPAAPHRIGPFDVWPVLAVQDVGIDSNVYNRADAPAPDFTFTVRPTVEATTRPRGGLLTLRSATELVYFAREGSERSVNEEAAAAAQVPFRRLTLLGGLTYLNTRQRPNEEIDARSRRIEHGADAGARFAVTPKVSLGVQARTAGTRFDGAAIFAGSFLAEELNRDARTVGGAVRYSITPLTAVAVTHDVTQVRFIDALDRDARSQQTMAGVELHPRALIAGNASFGYQEFRPVNGRLPPFTGPVGAANLTYRAGPQTRLGVSYERSLAYSYSDIQPYYVRAGWGGTLRRQLIARWDLGLSATRFTHGYRTVTAAAAFPGGPRSDSLLDAGVALGYQARPGTRLTLALTYFTRESTIPESNYHNARIATSFAYGF